MENKKMAITTIIATIIFICFLCNISLLNFFNYFYYIFNKDKEFLSIDKSEIAVKYEDNSSSENISCQLDQDQYALMKTNSDCIIDNDIKYIGFSVYLYNSYSKIQAVLNDKTVLKIERISNENDFIWKDTYKINQYIVRGYLENTQLVDGLNKITVNGNNKTDTIYIYKK